MKNNTIYIKKSDLDQFYTSENIAKDCYNEVLNRYSKDKISIFFEPSAGNGVFYNLFPEDKRVGIDIDPKCEGIKKQDFFEYIPSFEGDIITIGNPPFGKNASLAVKFFNQAAKFSKIICFIVPKTFQKKSIINRLNLNFHLKLNKDLPKNSFILNEQPYDVPCCFQIWEKSKNKRRIKKISLDNDFFTFVKKNEADLAVRRVGGRTGKATIDIINCAEVSHYFLKIKDKISIIDLVEQINNINFNKIINSTAGVKSLSKPEFVSLFLKRIK